MAISHARRTHADGTVTSDPTLNDDGFMLAEPETLPDRDAQVNVKTLAYADDLTAFGKTKEEATLYAQAMTTMLGVFNIRVQGKKCIYARSTQAAKQDSHAPLHLIGLEIINPAQGQVAAITSKHDEDTYTIRIKTSNTEKGNHNKPQRSTKDYPP